MVDVERGHAVLLGRESVFTYNSHTKILSVTQFLSTVTFVRGSVESNG